jgi:CBS domain-containing protein
MKKISDVMTRDVRIASPNQTIREVADEMAKADVGSLPVGENDRLVGMITDRDIVLRAVAKGRDPKTPVRDVMTDRIQYCYEDDDVTTVAENMATLGVRRLAVLNSGKRLVGIVALSNVANCGESKATNKLLKGVAEPHLSRQGGDRMAALGGGA